jgi:coproporphyrinogen III oxidase-like Fe-S oxidoreductase
MKIKKLNELISIYFHFPYCKKICPYCDFNRYKKDELKIEEERIIFEGYEKLVDRFFSQEENQNRSIKTIYFGGGTPSLIQPIFIKKLLKKLKEINKQKDIEEVTIEVNPESSNYLSEYFEAGINRYLIIK